jgi:hypothetical protein
LLQATRFSFGDTTTDTLRNNDQPGSTANRSDQRSSSAFAGAAVAKIARDRAIDLRENRAINSREHTQHKQVRLKIAESSLKRLKDKVRGIVVGNAYRKLDNVIAELNPVLRGWTSYFRLTETKRVLEDLDSWIRRKLRCLLWRQWKRPATRNKRLQARGLDGTRAWKSASNGRGPWWNAGASHMHAAYPKRVFDLMGLVSVLDTQLRFQIVK